MKGAYPRASKKVIEAQRHRKAKNDFGSIYKRGRVPLPKGAEEDRDAAREHRERPDFRRKAPGTTKQEMAQAQASQGSRGFAHCERSPEHMPSYAANRQDSNRRACLEVIDSGQEAKQENSPQNAIPPSRVR
jgi:hypothetical protein